MANYNKFLIVNGLKQKDIVNLLGISKPFASQIVNGSANLSPEKLDELIKKSNQLGYDVSMLTSAPNINATASHNSNASVTINDSHSTKDTEIAVLKERVATLEKRLEEEKQRSAQYWEMILKMMK